MLHIIQENIKSLPVLKLLQRFASLQRLQEKFETIGTINNFTVSNCTDFEILGCKILKKAKLLWNIETIFFSKLQQEDDVIPLSESGATTRGS